MIDTLALVPYGCRTAAGRLPDGLRHTVAVAVALLAEGKAKEGKVAAVAEEGSCYASCRTAYRET